MARSKEFDEEVVLDKAVKLFACKGFNATSAQEVVDALGISRSSLYDTFGDKRTLFLRALEKYRFESDTKFINHLDSTENPRDTLQQFLDNTVSNIIADTTCKGCFMLNSSIELSSHDAEVNKIVSQNRKNLEDAFFRLIKKGQELGQFTHKHSALSLARYLYSAIIGMQSLGKSDTDKTGLHDVARLTFSSFLAVD